MCRRASRESKRVFAWREAVTNQFVPGDSNRAMQVGISTSYGSGASYLQKPTTSKIGVSAREIES